MKKVEETGYERYVRERREEFYEDIFGMKVSLMGIPIPDRPKDVRIPLLPLVFHHGLKEQLHGRPIHGLFMKSKSFFGGSTSINEVLDEAISIHDRDHFGERPYAILVANRREARRIPAEIYNDLNVTLPERLFHGLYYWWRSGKTKQLDTYMFTLCEGSRAFEDKIPTVDFDKGVQIRLFDSDSIPSRACPRQVWLQ